MYKKGLRDAFAAILSDITQRKAAYVEEPEVWRAMHFTEKLVERLRDRMLATL